MSREWVLKTLVGLGLSEVEAEVYIFIVQAGPVKGRDIAETLKLYKKKVYRSLKTLQDKGMISATFERPAQFYAVSLEKILDLFMETKTEQAKNLQSNREKLLSSWRSMIEKNCK